MSGLLFAAADALCATVRLQWLLELEPLGFSGLLSASPPAIRGFENATGHTVFTAEQHADPAFAKELKARLANAAKTDAAAEAEAKSAA